MAKKDSFIADVYLAKIPSGIGQGVLLPIERQNEVLACKNERVKGQKYYAWKLLEHALRESFGYKIGDLEFCKGKNGKWTTPRCHFSISHSYNVVAVAVASGPIGVDVEKIAPEKAEFLQKTLTEQEREEFALIIEACDRAQYLFESWTKKESIFKKAGDGSFRPSKIAVDIGGLATKKLSIDGEEYVLSVAAENAIEARYFLDVDLSEKDVQ